MAFESSNNLASAGFDASQHTIICIYPKAGALELSVADVTKGVVCTYIRPPGECRG